jgi:hypothetical protein
MNTPPQVDLATIIRTLNLLHEPGSVVELRILNTGKSGTVSGYFTDMGKLADAAAQWSGQAPAVYVTLNPCNPDLLARAANHIITRAKHTTADVDILHRRWFPLDFDPARPAGISSTEAEHAAALERMAECRAWLQGQGWPVPIAADSGNGGHLLYPIDLPNDDTSRELVKRCLESLDFWFADERMLVDKKVFNAARIWKLYGTLTRKGDKTPERPHRLTQLLDVPDIPQVVTRTQLEALAALVPQQPKPEPRHGGRGKLFNLERWIAEHELPVVQEKPWNGGRGRVWVLNPCPWNGDHTNKAAYIVQFAGGAVAAGCHHNGCADNDWRALRTLYDGEGGQPLADDGTACPYEATKRGLVWHKPTQNGAVPVRLTNFTAEIVADTRIDDGAEVQRTFTLTARLGEHTATFDVVSAQFASMSWVTEYLGAGAIVMPGMTLKDHARTAMQMLSRTTVQRHVYAHLGWRQIGGRWCYLHAGGAIGPDGTVAGVDVHTTNELARYALPDPPNETHLHNAIKASLRLLDVAPCEITFPLYGALWRAALAEGDFSLHLVGPTGAGKTALAALAQQHFGAAMNARHLPANWTGTANALEAIAFTAKDVLLTVDEFTPADAVQAQALQRTAERLFRAQANHTGRQRMRADTTLRPAKPPRGLLVSTGEDVPKGQSLRARMLIVDVEPNTVDWSSMTQCQHDAASGLYAQALAGFVRWLAPQYGEVLKRLTVERDALRQQALQSGMHRRIPENVASLGLGWQYFLQFAQKAGALTASEAQARWDAVWATLGIVAQAQGQYLATAEPARRFVELLQQALASGRVHLLGAGDAGPLPPCLHGACGWSVDGHPLGLCVGWLPYHSHKSPQADLDVPSGRYTPGNVVYLLPEASYAVAQALAHATGETLMVSSRTLHKRLWEQGYLAEVDRTRGTATVRRKIDGVRQEVLALSRGSLLPETDQTDQTDQAGA